MLPYSVDLRCGTQDCQLPKLLLAFRNHSVHSHLRKSGNMQLTEPGNISFAEAPFSTRGIRRKRMHDGTGSHLWAGRSLSVTLPMERSTTSTPPKQPSRTQNGDCR